MAQASIELNVGSSVAEFETALRDLAKYEDLRKATAIQMLQQIKALEAQNDQMDRKAEQQQILVDYFREKLQLESRSLEDIARLSFVVVLIDADHMIFRNDFLIAGQAGGDECARSLKQIVHDRVIETDKNISSAFEIIIRAFANCKSLGKHLAMHRNKHEKYNFEDFVCGFNQADPCCEFIDVGSGQDRADAKLRSSVEFYLKNQHCKQVFFAGSRNNGYARLFEQYIGNRSIAPKITLVEGPPFAQELKEICCPHFKTWSIPAIFSVGMASVENVSLPLQDSQIESSNGATVVGQEPLESTIKLHPVAIATQIGAEEIKDCSSQPIVSQVRRNSFDERMDSVVHYDPKQLHWVKSKNLCPPFYINGYCPTGVACARDHQTILEGNQRETLRYVARLKPCINGVACDDAYCLSGHRCPRKQPCVIVNCRFPEAMHGA